MDKKVLDRSPRHETQTDSDRLRIHFGNAVHVPSSISCGLRNINMDCYSLKHLPTAVNLLENCSHQNSHPTNSKYASKNPPNWSRPFVFNEVTTFDKGNRLQGVVVVSTQGCRTLIKIKSCAFNLFPCFFDTKKNKQQQRHILLINLSEMQS